MMNKLQEIIGRDCKVITASADRGKYNYTPLVGDTDGFNFQMPKTFRYTDENPYVSKGLGRNYPKGMTFTKVEADVAEFEDLYLNESYASGINKMGLGIDEYVPASINFARKNYADLLDAEKGTVKLVGNTVKSKKMPIYIEKFMDKAIKLLLYGKGKEFLDYYYDYIDDIYNLRIPLKDIASVGKIKTSLEDYKKACSKLTKSGSKKARQAWYELAIRENLDVHMGDAIYYINTGTKKNESDVQRRTKYMVGTVDKTKEFELEYNKVKKDTNPKKTDTRVSNGRMVWIADKGGKTYSCIKLSDFVKKYYPYAKEIDEIVFNCIMVPNDIVEDEDNHFCDENLEYNVSKYIEQFNKRIRPLLVCFSKKIRTRIDPKTNKEIDNILVSNPDDRKEFTDAEAKLTSGEPYKPTDQDTYTALMTMEDKEISFWIKSGKKPLFAEEIGMDWDTIVDDYNKRCEILSIAEVNSHKEKILEAIKKMDNDAIVNNDFPDIVLSLSILDNETGNLIDRQYNVPLVNLREIMEERGVFSDENNE